MSSLLVPARRILTQESRQDIRNQVRRVICGSRSCYSGPERRSSPRMPFPYPIQLTPVDPSGDPEHTKTFAVVGRHLSECGLDFYHTEPVASRRLIASLDVHDEAAIGFVMELTWCRFGRHGWYENGGRFVSIAHSPFCDD